MRQRGISATVGRTVAACAVTAGLMAVVSQTVSASAVFVFYAAANGHAANAPCTNRLLPCDVQTALAQEALAGGGAPGNVIRLANGNYNIPAIVPVAGNDNVLIEGTSNVSTRLRFNAASGNGALIDLTHVTGVTVERIRMMNPVPAGTTVGVLMANTNGNSLLGARVLTAAPAGPGPAVYRVMVCGAGNPPAEPCANLGLGASKGDTFKNNFWNGSVRQCQFVDFNAGENGLAPNNEGFTNAGHPVANGCVAGFWGAT